MLEFHLFFFCGFFFLWPWMLFRSDLAHHAVIIEISNCYVICSTYLILLYQYSIIMYGKTSQMAKCWEFFLCLFHFFIFVKCAQKSNNPLYCYEREPVLRAVILFNLTLWLSDQEIISPCNINTILNRQETRIEKKYQFRGLLADPLPNSPN